MDNQPDLAQLRGFTADVIKEFNVRNNGNGWEYDTKTLNGDKATRWKSYSSTCPEGSSPSEWHKYLWKPSKPTDAKYFYPPIKSLMDAIKAEEGVLWLVGGEMAVMAMFSAKIENVTSFFGDNTIPETLLQDLKALGVTELRVVADRDNSGQTMAVNVRDRLKDDLSISLFFIALPYPVEAKHGKDVNDFWLEKKEKPEDFYMNLMLLDEWKLPESEIKPVLPNTHFETMDTDKLPQTFKDAILRDVEGRGKKTVKWGANGWSSNFPCPFHDDQVASAGFNRESMSFKCFTTCGSMNAKTYGEKVGIQLRDYLDSTPTIPAEKIIPLPVEVKSVEPKPLRPALPAGVTLTTSQKALAKQGRKWLDDYLAWTRIACPLPPEIFHEAMALWLLATVATRRIKVVMGGQEIYPNLYILVIAKTSLYRKSTAMKAAKKLLKQARLESLLLPTDVTPEALFDELAGVKPVNFESLPLEEKTDWLQGRAVAAQRSFLKDECSSIFASLKKDYNAGLTELLLEGYEGDGGKLKKQLKTKGMIVVKDMCLSFLGATTPVMYGKYITNEESENGFVARFAIITPEGMPQYTVIDEPAEIPSSLVTQLRQMFMQSLPWHNNQPPSASMLDTEVLSPPVTSVTIDPKALKQMMGYQKALGYDLLVSERVDDTKAAAYTRLGTMMIKVAMLLAAIDTTIAPIRIEEKHAYAAQEILERWRESLHRLDTHVAHSNGNNANEKVMGYLNTAGSQGASIRDIMRDCGIKNKKDVEEALKALYEDGVIEKFDHKPKGPGRPSIRYRATMSETANCVTISK